MDVVCEKGERLIYGTIWWKSSGSLRDGTQNICQAACEESFLCAMTVSFLRDFHTSGELMGKKIYHFSLVIYNEVIEVTWNSYFTYFSLTCEKFK